MAANIHRNSIADAAFVPIANGNEIAFHGDWSPVGVEVTIFLHLAATDGPNLFSNMGGVVLGDEFSLIDMFLTYGNMWNAKVPGTNDTWHEIANTKGYYSVREQRDYPGPGTENVVVAMRDWLMTHDTATCESATDPRWFQQFIIAQKIQPALNAIISRITVPTPPPVYVPVVLPPHEIGRIDSMATLFFQQCLRLKGTAVGNTVTVGVKPVPT